MSQDPLVCPYCGFRVKRIGWGEIEHMEAAHMDVIVKRFQDAGMVYEARLAQAKLDAQQQGSSRDE